MGCMLNMQPPSYMVSMIVWFGFSLNQICPFMTNKPPGYQLQTILWSACLIYMLDMAVMRSGCFAVLKCAWMLQYWYAATYVEILGSNDGFSQY